MPHINDINKKILAEGIVGQYVHGNEATLGWVTIKAGSTLQAHKHHNEQITMMIEGTMEMKIGDETIILTPGIIHVIPSNTIHSAIAITDCKLIDVFSPVREDYRS